MPTVHPLTEPRFAEGATLEFGWGEAGLRSLAPVADVELAAQFDADEQAALLTDDAYQAVIPSGNSQGDSP